MKKKIILLISGFNNYNSLIQGNGFDIQACE